MLNADTSKSGKLVRLFLTATLLVTPACGQQQANGECQDQNQDGYCDENGGSGSRVYRGFHYAGGSKIYHDEPAKVTSGATSGITSAKPKGGIGSTFSSGS